jgi:hypothetical protein
MAYLWRRMGEEGRQRVWSLYGWFCGLMVCGSCFGAVTWAARMMNLVNFFKSNDAFSKGDFVEQNSLTALANSWLSVFSLTYAIEFLCLSTAKLMVLDRMSDFAAGQDEGTRKRWAAGGRMVMAVVVLGNAVGLAANFASAVHSDNAAVAALKASSYFAANRTNVAEEYVSSSRTEIQLALSSSSVQSLSEAAMLLLIVTAFLVTGFMCIRRIRLYLLLLSDHNSSDRAMSADACGRSLQRQIVGTIVVVFVSFVARSVFSVAFAVSRQLQDGSRRCPGVTSPCDASCFNVYTHMSQWMAYTPEFQVTVVLVSSPLTLLVALWGMTSRQALQAMTPGKGATVQLQQILLQRPQ